MLNIYILGMVEHACESGSDTSSNTLCSFPRKHDVREIPCNIVLSAVVVIVIYAQANKIGWCRACIIKYLTLIKMYLSFVFGILIIKYWFETYQCIYDVIVLNRCPWIRLLLSRTRRRTLRDCTLWHPSDSRHHPLRIPQTRTTEQYFQYRPDTVW